MKAAARTADLHRHEVKVYEFTTPLSKAHCLFFGAAAIFRFLAARRTVSDSASRSSADIREAI